MQKIPRRSIAELREMRLQPVPALRPSNRHYVERWSEVTFTGLSKSMLILSVVFVLGAVGACQSISEPTIPANDLIRAVVANELKAPEENGTRWMYRVDRVEQGHRTVKEVVQTVQGSLERLVSTDGHPLSPNQEVEEAQRIQNLINNTAEQRKMEEKRKKDAEQCRTLFKLIPDAFVFSYAGTEANVVKLNYRPNPNFQPPSREARVFHALEGEVWVQASDRRLVRMRGHLTSEVKFAGGLLGHLDSGGYFDVMQRELSPGQWDMASMDIDMKGKILFKTIAVQQKEYRSDFQRLPTNLSLSEAADILMKQVLVAANR